MTEYGGDCPKTAEEWWVLAERYADQLGELLVRYHPTQFRQHESTITAPGAELVCEQARREIRERSGLSDAPAEFRSAVERRDGKTAARLLEETWFGMPESAEVRSDPGFGLLCDLCSESGVLFDA